VRKASIAPVALLCVACGGGGGGTPDLGGRVNYHLSEAMVLTGSAGSCLSGLYEEYVPERHQLLRYAVGARMGVDVYWPDRTDCKDRATP
jgi:hypothetical protein